MKLRYLSLFLLAQACATTVRPETLREADKVAQGASAQESRTLAPQLYLRAEQLRKEADDELDRGKTPAAEVKAARAIAVYEHAQVLSRIVKAEQRLIAARAELSAQQKEALALDGRRQTIAAELASLEAEIQVEREAEAIAESKITSGEREEARKKAATTALVQARLLCIAAEELGADKAAIGEAINAIGELEAQTQSAKGPYPLHLAIKSRSRCQELLTLVRRPARSAAPHSETTDRLFVELSEASLAPSRDDRGIVVTFRDAPKEAAIKQLAALSHNYADTPLLVVTHSGTSLPTAAEQSKAESFAKQLKDAGAKSVRVHCVGGKLPLEASLSATAAKSNERVEVIFITKI